MTLKIINEPPPNYVQLAQHFPVKEHVVFFPWGDVLYNPSAVEIPADVLFHEQIHAEQQKAYGIEKWWVFYCLDKAFRLEQELQAYAGQYHFVRKHVGAKAGQLALEEMAGNLSSKLYQLDLSHNEAKAKIHRRARQMFEDVKKKEIVRSAAGTAKAYL